MAGQKNTANGAATPSADKENISASIIAEAKAKIKPSDAKKLGRYEKAVNSAVANALKDFCEQSEEFARAIVETDKSYDDCLLTICKGLARLLKAAETNGTATYRNKVRNLLASAIERTENIDCQEG